MEDSASALAKQLTFQSSNGGTKPEEQFKAEVQWHGHGEIFIYPVKF